MPINEELALNSGIQTYQILTNDDEVCIPSLYSILIAVIKSSNFTNPSLPQIEMINIGHKSLPIIIGP